MENNIMQQAEQIQEEIVEIRRTLHHSPEAGAVLPRTKQFVLEKLKEYGYEPQEICESGITAVITGNPEGKTILLRADMDALKIQEKSGCEFQSENGYMHACGHDMHAAMLLGAAKLLRENQSQLNGTVKLVFQPDEEGFTGAKRMLKAGVLENPKVDAGFALHVHSGTPTGLILGGKGVCMASCTLFRIRVKGTGCHGAMPETGVDPINIAAHIYLALQEIIAREISAKESAVVTIGRFAGGDAPNIIPQEVVMEGTIRSLNRELGENIFRRIQDISEATARMFRGEAEVTEIASAPPLVNNEELTETMGSYVRELCGDRSVVLYEGGGMGSEDFSSYTYEIPCSYLLLGAGTEKEDPRYGKPMHNEKVVFNEKILSMGAAIHAYCAIRWLKDNG